MYVLFFGVSDGRCVFNSCNALDVHARWEQDVVVMQSMGGAVWFQWSINHIPGQGGRSRVAKLCWHGHLEQFIEWLISALADVALMLHMLFNGWTGYDRRY